MVSCDILDFKCIYMNEIFGNVALALVGVVIFYFIIASKMRLGFDTTIVFAFPLILIGGLMISGFSIVFAFATIVVGLMVAWIFNIMVQGR